MLRRVMPEFPTLPRGNDFLTSFGAGVLAGYIDSYWRARGYAGIVTERYEITTGVFGIRSNIGPTGFPPRVKAVRA